MVRHCSAVLGVFTVLYDLYPSRDRARTSQGSVPDSGGSAGAEDGLVAQCVSVAVVPYLYSRFSVSLTALTFQKWAV